MKKALVALLSLAAAFLEASDFYIYCAQDAAPPELFASQELARFVQESTGESLPLRRDFVPGKTILVGQSNEALRLLALDSWSGFEPDEIILKSAGDALVLAGGRPRGTVYAVYEFLERELGIRFFAPDETFIPKRDNFVFAPQDLRQKPTFAVREILFDLLAEHPECMPRMRTNGHWYDIPPEQGGREMILGFCHTLGELLPSKQFFTTHPEYYALRDGRRQDSQPCLTHPEVIRIVVENALGWLRENPSAKIISISQNDNQLYCQCQRCSALGQEEGSPSGSLIAFVNQVAEGIEKEFPEVIVDTLAYNHTRHAPRTLQPRHNVMIRLCSIEQDYSKPLDHPVNKAFSNDLKEWGMISSRLGVWDYDASYHNYFLVQPVFTHYRRNLAMEAANHAFLNFREGMHTPNAGIMGFAPLQTYLLKNLLWDVGRDQDALTREFAEHYYGPGAPEFLQVIRLLEKDAMRPEASFGCYDKTSDNWLQISTLLQCRELLAKAAEHAGAEDRFHQRREELAFHFDVTLLGSSHFSRFNPEAAELRKKLDPILLFAKVRKRASAGNLKYRLGNSRLVDYLDQIKDNVLAAGNKDVPAICQGLADDQWMDIQETGFRWPPAVIDDPDASNGRASRGRNSSWVPQCVLPQLPGTWKAYAAIRTANAEPGAMVLFAVHREKGGDRLTPRPRTVEAASFLQDYYAFLELGELTLQQPGYLYMSCGQTDLLVDRFVLVKVP